jgi:small redox-active disulfide protein 2
MLIKVLGSGCPKCKSLYETVKNVVGEDKEIVVEYVTEITALLEAGVMSSPALMLDGKVVSSGRVPSEEEIKGYIEDGKEEPVQASGCSCGSC